MRDPFMFAAKLKRQQPRNLQEMPSAYEIGPENAPINVYQQSALRRLK
jgi:hypothetical protein